MEELGYEKNTSGEYHVIVTEQDKRLRVLGKEADQSQNLTLKTASPYINPTP